MPETTTRRLPRLLGYVAFTVLALAAGFFLTFPYETLRERVRLEADRAGYFVRIASMGPGFLAVRASSLEVSKKADSETAPEALQLDSVSFGPSFFPPGLALRVRALGGAVTAVVSGVSTTRVRVDAEGLDLTRGNVKGFSGIDLSGTIEGHLDLAIPRVAAGGAPAEPDLSQASGTLTLDTRGLAVNGGNVSIVIPQFGPEPTPLDLPKIVLGDVMLKVKVEKGAATIEDFKAKSADLEASASGTVKLAKRLEYSEPTVEIRYKPDPEFQKRLGLLGSALSMVGPDPKDPSWRLGKLSGYLGRPQFR